MNRIAHPLCGESLFSFCRLRKLFLLITFLPLTLVLGNHLHSIDGDLWLLSTTATTAFFHRFFSVLTLDVDFVTTVTFGLILAGIQNLPKSVFWVLYFKSLLKLVIVLH